MPNERRRGGICVVGPGTRFLSGITYYTYGLASALGRRTDVCVLFLRRLLPRLLYPGRARVGRPISTLVLPPSLPSLDGVDWYWLPSLFRAAAFLARQRPRVVVLQWWTGTALHTYVALAFIARLLGARIVIEFHETLDTGEARLGIPNRYVHAVMPLLLRQVDAAVVHSEFDRELIDSTYGLQDRLIAVIPHATYDHYRRGGRLRAAPEGVCNFLFFGIIRPFKGVEDLVRAFESIPTNEIDRYWLTVVGETWEGWTLPGELIGRSPYRDRITFVNRYATDEETDGFFGGADVVVLPYHRSSQSGPLQIAMNYGLPVVTTKVGGLVEAVRGFEGAFLVEPANPKALLAAMCEAASARERDFSGPYSWDTVAERYEAFLTRVAPVPRAVA